MCVVLLKRWGILLFLPLSESQKLKTLIKSLNWDRLGILLNRTTNKPVPYRLVFEFWSGWITHFPVRCHNKKVLAVILPHISKSY